MLTTVRLDDQPGAKVDEVDDIGADGLLATELLSIQAMGAQMAPEQ
jgi:hypothetical protein